LIYTYVSKGSVIVLSPIVLLVIGYTLYSY
jgi:hypothetical protein